MKTEQVLAPPLEVPKVEIGMVSDVLALTKARLTTFVLLTTFVGFWIASGDHIQVTLLVHTLLGTGFVAASAAILNQAMEANRDRMMRRTRNRPLPAGRMKISTGYFLGSTLGVLGLGYLWFAVNPLCSALALLTLVIYLALYTPLKRRTSLCVMVGAVSGAIPPVIGWAAVDPKLSAGAWILFGLLFAWQIPHFLAIAWMYRDEYAEAGFVMLQPRDVSGVRAASLSVLFSVALLLIALLPWLLAQTSALYLGAALVVNGFMLFCATRFLLHRTRATALQLFFASIAYLPMMLGLMVFLRN